MVGEYHGIKFLGCHLIICKVFKHGEYAMHFVLFNQDKKEELFSHDLAQT